jgi:hypothetical protein
MEKISTEEIEKEKEQINNDELNDDKDVQDNPEEKDDSEIKEQKNQPTYSRRFLTKSKTSRQKPNYSYFGKSIKSGASSFTNDSSLKDDPLSSSRDSEEKRAKRSFDIEYPSLKRCHSTKKYHYSKDYKDIIKEEKYEDEGDSICSCYSSRSKFSSYTIMPKDNLFFLEKKKLFDENTIKAISTMEPVPETYDENLIFQKPKIQLLSDRKEDSKLNVIPNSTLNVKKAPLDENEIIQEVKELDGIFDEEFDQKLDSIKIKYKSFYDKEEPPILFSGLQGECKPFDDIPDEIAEEDFDDDAKEVIRKNSIIIQRKKNIADEIDDDFKKNKRTSKLNLHEKICIDEKDELNNKEDNEEKEEKEEKEDKDDDKDEEKEEESDKGSKNSNE